MKGCFTVIIIIFLVLFLGSMFVGNDSSQRTSSSSSSNISKSHQEYLKRDQGYGSSFLPRIGKTKGDDYRNCIEKKYHGPYDPHDFCAWHAGIGKYQ